MPKTLKINSHKRKNKTRKNKQIIISSDFESGNIVKLDSTTNNNVHLEIRGEKYKKIQINKYRNWFYFKAKNINQKTTFTIHDLKNFDDDWKGYTVCYSYDNKKWKRLPTKVDLKKLKMTWKINPKKSTIWFCYYPPYPFSRSKKLFSSMKTIGYTNDKNPILMKKIGDGPKRVWLISGQHSGETINSWILEGFVKKLMERKNKKNLSKYTFYIIPNLNPDGNKRGYWYVTSKGINLNRDWLHTKSPEVKAVKNQMKKYGYDLVFDIHGDEGCKNHFLVRNYYCNHNLFYVINRKLNKKNKNFQLKNYYSSNYLKGARDTLDDYTRGITIEGCMKHNIDNYKTLQDNPIQLGKDLLDVLSEI